MSKCVIAILVIGAVAVMVFGSYWIVCAVAHWSREDYRRGLKAGRYYGDLRDL